MGDRAFPHSLEAERALLGGFMVEPDALDEVSGSLAAEDFYRPDHRALYELLCEMRTSGEAIDLVTVPERVCRGANDEVFGGLAYVLDLPDAVPSTTNLPHYANVVRDKAHLRRVIETADRMRARAYAGHPTASEVVDEASESLTRLAVGQADRGWTHVGRAADEEVINIEARAKVDGNVTGITTGYTALDTFTAGLHPGDLVILAARPAMGKTALALNLALNAALLGQRATGVYSLEMSKVQLVGRLLCSLGDVDAGRMRTGNLTNEDWDRVLQAHEVLQSTPLHIDDQPGQTLGSIAAKARRLKTMEPTLGVLVVDYLQLMQGSTPGQSRQEQISEISRGLKLLAKELEVCIIALSQLNRDLEKRADKRPKMADLRESGALEQDADAIAFVYRPAVYDPDEDPEAAEVIFGKHRAGPTGTVELRFIRRFCRFDEPEGDIGLVL
jgi:replicative DNA helicase